MSAERIRELNDSLRMTLRGGRLMMTAGVERLPLDVRREVVRTVMNYGALSRDNDPDAEHDFGRFEVDGCTFFWKIDYYEASMEFGADDPANPAKTTRVLTIMLAREY